MHDPAETAADHDVLFCTHHFAVTNHERLATVAPGLDLVSLRDGERVAPDDIERITMAFFSTDAWPERAESFMRVALEASNLRWLHTMSAGVDSPIFSLFTDRGVVLTNSSGASAAPIASSVIMYLLALSRRLPELVRAQGRAEWSWHRWDDIAGRSVAVVGWGPIGQHVARLADAHGMAPTIVRREVRGDEPYPVRRLDELTAVAATHDTVVLAVPLTASTRHLVSTEVLDAMPAHGVLVNVGRGELVDQHALDAALRSGLLGGAAIDVTDPEPLPADDPLWSAPNLIITPHNSGSCDTTEHNANEMFFENLERWVTGTPLLREV